MDGSINVSKVLAADSDAKRQKIYRFRYQVYVDEMGKKIREADHQNRILKDELDEWATLFYIESNDEVIATIRRITFDTIEPAPFLENIFSMEKFSGFSKEKLSFTSKVMVKNEWRGTSVLATLFSELYGMARNEGVILFDFCHCTPALIFLYEILGYRRYTQNFVDDDAGFQVPMVFVLEDIDHLKKVRSPFYKQAKKYKNNSETAQWFSTEFSDYSGYYNSRTMASEDLWLLLSEKLHQLPTKKIPLLKGLDSEEAKKFLSMATIVQCKKGDEIIRPGDTGKEMFVIISGVVEIFGNIGDKRFSLTILESGQIFGEISFVTQSPRTASVVALSELEVLILTPQFFNKTMKQFPEITCKVLFNLSLTLCERLRLSTTNWLYNIK